MGTYLYVRCPDKASQDRILAFMAEHFTLSDELMPWVDTEWGVLEEVPKGKVVCAYALPLDVGFYYGAGTPEGVRIYM